MKKNIIKMNIILIGRRWFQRANGNTYHTVEIYVDGQFLCKSERTYGYGSTFESTALAILADRFFITKEDAKLPPHLIKDVKIVSSVTDVQRKKDL